MTASIVKNDQRVADNDIMSYGNYVGGKNLTGEEWIYALSPRALLDDSFASLALKRGLERGEITASQAPPGVVVGRVAVADSAMVAATATAAAAAMHHTCCAPYSSAASRANCGNAGTLQQLRPRPQEKHRHLAIGMISPVDFEDLPTQAAQAT